MMDGVSAIFAVVSLGIQLAGTIRQVTDFLRSVENAPDEIKRLVEILDQLCGTLEHVKNLIQQQSSILDLPGSYVSIVSALRGCEKRVIKLERLINSLKRYVDRNHMFQKAWGALKTILKKEEIVELRRQLYEDMMSLQLSISMNSAQLQLHQIQTSPILSSSTRMSVKEQPLSSQLDDSICVSGIVHQRRRKNALDRDGTVISMETSSVAYWGLFGNVRIQSNSKHLARLPRSQEISQKPISEETKIIITPSFLRRGFEMRYINSLGRVSRTLNVYPTLEYCSPPFVMCIEGDLQGLQKMLSNRTVSPFVMDWQGMTLLHYAALGFQTEVCSMLLQIGLDPDQTANWGSIIGVKAFHLVGNRPKLMVDATKATVDTLRVLTQAQEDISATDVSNYFGGYMWSPAGADFMYSLDAARCEILKAERDTNAFPALAVALRAYGGGSKAWETFIRRLLRNRVDVHAIVPRMRFHGHQIAEETSYYPCHISEPATPLDELFRCSKTPFEGSEAASDWLQILSSEGFDIQAYIKEEAALHARQQHLTYPSATFGDYDSPRKLIFELGPNPSVSWDWWIVHNSPASLVRQELRHMNIFGHHWQLALEPWERCWPFVYAEWSDTNAAHRWDITYQDWRQINQRAQRRAERRLRKKAVKEGRSQGNHERSRMPGAWIA